MKRFGVAIALLLLAGTGAALGQQASAPTATGETGLFTLLDGWTLPQGQWSVGIYYNNWDRLVAPVPGGLPVPYTDDWDYDWNRLSASLGYGLTDRFELSVMVPWDDISASDNLHAGFLNGRYFEDEIDASGIGNVRLGMKYQLFGRPEEGEALALNAFFEAPTGDDDEGVVPGDTGWGLGLNWNFSPRWMARVGYRDPGDSDHFDVAEELETGLGYVVALNGRFDWVTELVGTFYQGGDSTPDDAIDLTTGGRYWMGEDARWAFNFALRTELNQLSDTDEHCPIGGLVGFTFFPRAKSAAAVRAEREAAERAAAAAAAAKAAAEGAANAKTADEAAAFAAAARRAADEAAAAAAPGAGPAAAKSAEEAAAYAKAAEEAAAKKAAEEAAAQQAAAAAAKQAADQAAAAKAAEEAARQAAEEARRKESRETVNFESGSARLSNIAKAKLDEVALRLKQDPAAIAVVVGYTDAQGGDAANRQLGERRAAAARDYLLKRHQIDPNRVRVESQGSGSPVAPNDSPAGREQNRRAEIVVRVP